jgi:hypothetical protein
MSGLTSGTTRIVILQADPIAFPVFQDESLTRARVMGIEVLGQRVKLVLLSFLADWITINAVDLTIVREAVCREKESPERHGKQSGIRCCLRELHQAGGIRRPHPAASVGILGSIVPREVDENGFGAQLLDAFCALQQIIFLGKSIVAGHVRDASAEGRRRDPSAVLDSSAGADLATAAARKQEKHTTSKYEKNRSDHCAYLVQGTTATRGNPLAAADAPQNGIKGVRAGSDSARATHLLTIL